MDKKFFGLCIVFLVLFSFQEVKQVEGRMCQTLSHYFKGPCGRNHNCSYVCRNEGFSGGRCRGFRRRCFCTKLC
ncbi:hypothetical protein RND81_04G191100 [Saponaria officinalis]|uniref:Knottins-like domain-containing protein n=1 Tax=Saponaria officinalis TaxID=3572 RepID=A0AAW1LNN4_SAPOF